MYTNVFGDLVITRIARDYATVEYNGIIPLAWQVIAREM